MEFVFKTIRPCDFFEGTPFLRTVKGLKWVNEGYSFLSNVSKELKDDKVWTKGKQTLFISTSRFWAKINIFFFFFAKIDGKSEIKEFHSNAQKSRFKMGKIEGKSEEINLLRPWVLYGEKTWPFGYSRVNKIHISLWSAVFIMLLLETFH